LLEGTKFSPKYSRKHLPGSWQHCFPVRTSLSYYYGTAGVDSTLDVLVRACRRDKKARRSRSRETKSRGRDSKSQESDDRTPAGEGKVRLIFYSVSVIRFDPNVGSAIDRHRLYRSGSGSDLSFFDACDFLFTTVPV
jgi:hypothetical protein